MMLKTKRDYEVYVQCLRDIKQTFNNDIDMRIEYFETQIRFIGKMK